MFAQALTQCKLSLSIALTVGVTLATAIATQPALAQSTTADTLQETPQSGEYNADPFSSNGNGQMNSVFDLIHRASMGGGRSWSEVQEDQRETISSEAVEFRNRQMELLRQQDEPQPANSPTPTNQN